LVSFLMMEECQKRQNVKDAILSLVSKLFANKRVWGTSNIVGNEL